MISPPAKRNIPYVTHNNLFGHLRWAIEHNVFGWPAAKLLQCSQKINGHGHVCDAFHRLHLKGFVAGPQSLVDLLQTEQTCIFVKIEKKNRTEQWDVKKIGMDLGIFNSIESMNSGMAAMHNHPACLGACITIKTHTYSEAAGDYVSWICFELFSIFLLAIFLHLSTKNWFRLDYSVFAIFFCFLHYNIYEGAPVRPGLHISVAKYKNLYWTNTEQ